MSAKSEREHGMKMAAQELTRLAERCRRLEYALRYWIPDETMVEPEHKVAWDEHIALLTD